MFVAIANPSKACFEVLEVDGDTYIHTGDLLLTTIKTVTVPANKMGINGALRIRASGESDGINGVKVVGISFGATGIGLGLQLPAGNDMYWGFDCYIYNDNNAAVQTLFHMYYAGTTGGLTIDSGSIQALIEDTSSDVDIDVDVQLANAADSVQLNNISVEIFPQS